MKKTIDLIAAPAGMQPGGYIAKAYRDAVLPNTKKGSIEVVAQGDGYRVTLEWNCPNPVYDATTNTNMFVDAAAVLAPAVKDAPLFTMGAPEQALHGALWRADRKELHQIDSAGLGTVKRSTPPATWQVTSEWQSGAWRVVFDLAPWPNLKAQGQIAFAIWRGELQERGGLKSISPLWISLDQ